MQQPKLYPRSKMLILGSSQPVPEDQNKAHLTIRLDQMKATTYSDSRESFRVWTDFSKEESVKADSSILSSTLGKIADAALETLQASPSVENKAIFWKWQRRNESLLQRLGDSMYISQPFFWETVFFSQLFMGKDIP